MSSSKTASSSRNPLTALPLYRFVPGTAILPSPTSQPTTNSNKRPPPTPESDRTGKREKIVTPKVKAVLERDEFGIGKSPARKLFAEEISGASPSGGISGASTLPSPSKLRKLAPSPPIHSSPAAATPGTSYFSIPSSPFSHHSNIDDEFEHYPGFDILADTTVAIGPGTPISRKLSTAGSALPQITNLMLPPSSPASSSTSSSSYRQLENQENIPPPPTRRSSTTTTAESPGSSKYFSATTSPSKSSLRGSSPYKSGSSTYDGEDDDTLTGITGIIGVIVAESSPSRGGGSSTGKRKNGKSKLAQVIAGELLDEAMNSDEEEGLPEEDLTPGRRIREPSGKGKARMRDEVEG